MKDHSGAVCVIISIFHTMITVSVGFILLSKFLSLSIVPIHMSSRSTSLHPFILLLPIPSQMITKHMISHISLMFFPWTIRLNLVEGIQSVCDRHAWCFQFNMQSTESCIFTAALLLMEFEVFIRVRLSLIGYIFTTVIFRFGLTFSPPLPYILFFSSLLHVPSVFSHHSTGTFHQSI